MNGYSEEQDRLTKEQKKILKMDLAELMQLETEITSVSKRPQKIKNAASAIYVITQEDIRRSGSVNIMEVLRLAPGVLVSKINQNRYAISIRGFNRRLGSDKLLVLMDGRTIYSPADSGVFWIGQDYVLEDIDRIEVIRGPGASLWGSNAVAGVINIITKNSKETQGLLVSGGRGTEELGFVTARFGGEVKKDFNYRLYAKYRDRDEGKKLDNTDSFDGKKIGQVGFRSDWEINNKDTLVLQGDTYNLDADIDVSSRFVSLDAGSAPFKGSTLQTGANTLMRWTRTLDDSSSLKLQLYYDFLRRNSLLGFDNKIHQTDLDAQYDFLLGKKQNVSMGFNYRFVDFDFEKTNITETPNRDTNLFGIFINDEFTIIPETWKIILGSRFEHNDFTGFEYQPTARTIWQPKPNHTFWAAFSRAVRIPSFQENDGRINRALVPGALPLLIKEDSDGEVTSEILLSYEVGYRVKIKPNLTFDFTSFIFDYDDLIEFKAGDIFFESNPSPAHLVLPGSNDNIFEGEIQGAEISIEWQATKAFRLTGSYTFTNIDLRATGNASSTVTSSTFNPDTDFDAENEPQHIFNVRSYLNLPYDLEFDSLFYFVSENSARNVSSYNRMDLRLGWKPSDLFELSLVGQNILDETHSELNELLEAESETQRSFYGKLTFNF